MSITSLETVANPTYIPAITITTPTPTRSTTASELPGASAATPTNSTTNAKGVPGSYRLLYRGALSLPDSLLLLDGLTFAARLDSPSKQSTFHLLENPLALALESMRGRPTLRHLGIVNLKDVYLDESGGVEMDIHPLAMLSQIYFENTFCLLPFSSSVASTSNSIPPPQRSEIGVRVALGDSNGPETTEIVIFAQLVASSDSATKTIRLCVGRITQRPSAPQTVPRKPRPDDPIPRKPPAFFVRDLKRTGSLGVVGSSVRELKRVASGNITGAVPLKKQKLASNGSVADLGSGVRLGVPDLEPGDVVFKVPELPLKPSKVKGKGKEKDVFGDVSEVPRVGKGKQKADEGSVGVVDEAGFEKANKNVIKRSTIEYLGRIKDPTDATRFIDKSHSEFKDLYGFIYRGVGFALRAKMRTCNIEPSIVNRLIDMHALMYLGGRGGSFGA
ncbi:hypothetical protein M413DRAFT_448870 [Hebeloma cylindrosporum]|uniref:Sld7 C-terminal domain-containing protein n=1 Tax=Hebeloma cylindrosporum TaxID=76867 RepID=A0A0C3BZ52_HEBCY|nr:hypothetical protein M413DRAFT_448870 [Hebeloma cylindrosporum h7]